MERKLDDLTRDNKILVQEIEALKGELDETKELVGQKDEQMKVIYEQLQEEQHKVFNEDIEREKQGRFNLKDDFSEIIAKQKEQECLQLQVVIEQKIQEIVQLKNDLHAERIEKSEVQKKLLNQNMGNQVLAENK